MKIFNFYSNDVDRTWYQSSNIKYSECIDHENELKTLIVVFNNGTQYRYEKVDVKMENADLATLDGELSFRMEGGVFIDYDGKTIRMRDNNDKVVFEKEVKLNKDALNVICGILVAAGKDVKLITTEEFDNGETGED